MLGDFKSWKILKLYCVEPRGAATLNLNRHRREVTKLRNKVQDFFAVEIAGPVIRQLRPMYLTSIPVKIGSGVKLNK